MREQLSPQKVTLVNQLLADDSRPNPFYDAVLKKLGTDENIRVVKHSEIGKTYTFYIGNLSQSNASLMATRPLRFEKELVDKLEKELSIDIPEGETTPLFEQDSIELYVEVIKRYTKIKTSMNIGAIGEDDIAEFASAHGVLPRRSFNIRVLENAKLIDSPKHRTIRLTVNATNIATVVEDTVFVKSLAHHEIRTQLAEHMNTSLGKDVVFPEDISLPATHFVEGNRYTAILRSTCVTTFGKVGFKPDLRVIEK